jgi:hypothetical protein
MLYVLVEGHGEKRAVGNLVTRLLRDLAISDLHIRDVIRYHRITSSRGLVDGCNMIRARGDASALLILKDDEDNCPVKVVPSQMQSIAALGLPFPVGLCILYREYEVLFLASLISLVGQPLVDDRGISRPGILPTATYTDHLEAPHLQAHSRSTADDETCRFHRSARLWITSFRDTRALRKIPSCKSTDNRSRVS